MKVRSLSTKNNNDNYLTCSLYLPKLIFYQFWGWMHHKFRENSKELVKDATTGKFDRTSLVLFSLSIM